MENEEEKVWFIYGLIFQQDKARHKTIYLWFVVFLVLDIVLQ